MKTVWMCNFDVNSLFLVQGKLTASAVGQIVELQSKEIKLIASEYAEKVSADNASYTQPVFWFY